MVITELRLQAATDSSADQVYEAPVDEAGYVDTLIATPTTSSVALTSAVLTPSATTTTEAIVQSNDVTATTTVTENGAEATSINVAAVAAPQVTIVNKNIVRNRVVNKVNSGNNRAHHAAAARQHRQQQRKHAANKKANAAHAAHAAVVQKSYAHKH